jgi:Ion channel
MSSLYRHRFKLFLCAMLAIILVMPVVFEILADVSPGHGRPVAWGGGAFVMLVATLVVGGHRHARFAAYGLLIPSLIIELAAVFYWPDELLVIHFLVRIIFLSFIITEMLRQLFAPDQVSFDTVCASLCIYLLLGLTWENVYAIMEIARPGSILTVTRTAGEAPVGNLAIPWDDLFRMRYFSFATLTSVGYGDVVPGTTVARMCAITEALLGQIYLLVMVSRLVGMHISQAMPGASPPEAKKETLTNGG